MRVVIILITLLSAINTCFAAEVKDNIEFSKNTSFGLLNTISKYEYWNKDYPPDMLESQLHLNGELLFRSKSYINVLKVYTTDHRLIIIIEEHQSKYRDGGPVSVLNVNSSGSVVSILQKIDGLDSAHAKYDIAKLKLGGLINIRIKTSTGYIIYTYDVNSNRVSDKRYDNIKKLNIRCESLYKIIQNLDCSDPNLAVPMSLSREVDYYWLVGDENTSNRFYKECSRMDRENNILKYKYFKKDICGLN